MLQGLMLKTRKVMKHWLACPKFHSTGGRSQSGKHAAVLFFAILAMPMLAAAADDALKLIKIANDGSELPDSAALGTNPKDWACTLDASSGLIWEVKTANPGLRSAGNTYSWYSSEGRAIGLSSGGSCSSDGRCDTEKYIADVNSSKLCGGDNWRMPKAKELEEHFAVRLTSPSVYAAYFPNTTSTYYWSGTPGAFYSFSAWAVYVSDAQAYYFHRTGTNGIRAVRTSK